MHPSRSILPLAFLALAAAASIVPVSARAQAYSDTIPEVHFAVVRLDFLTLQIKGFYELSQPYRKVLPNGIREGEIYWQLRSPSDFGDLKVFSRLTGGLLVHAETIWNGRGSFLFPPDSLYDASLEVGLENPEPDTLIYRAFESYYSTREGADSAWARVRGTDVIERLAARGAYEVFLFSHFYTVGVSDPTTAEWIVVAYTHPPAPYDVGFVEIVWPKSLITRNVPVRPEVDVHNFGDNPDEAGIRLSVRGPSGIIASTTRSAGSLPADGSRVVDFGFQAFPDLGTLAFEFALTSASPAFWLDLYPENNLIEAQIEVTGQPVFRPASSVPSYGVPLDFDGDGDVDVVRPAGTSYFWQNDGTGSFTDITELSALTFRQDPRGVIAGDFDGDGLTDLLTVYWNKPPQLFLGDGSGAFRDFTTESGLAATLSWGPVAALDKEGDADLDILLPQKYGQDLLLENDGSGHFTDVATGSGFVNPEQTQSITTGDLNNDGHPDVALTNWGSDAKVFINDGSGGFTRLVRFWALKHGRDVLLFDQDGDGFQDMLFLQQSYFGPSRLYRNNGDLTFVDVTTAVGGIPSAFRADAGDFNGDGREDLVFDSGNLLLNLEGGFVDSTALLVMGGSNQPTGDPWFVDLEGDGDLDIYGEFTSYLNQGIDTLGDRPVAVRHPLPGPDLLRQNRPNPFNPETLILFELPRAGPVDLSVYDLAGRRVRRLVAGRLEAGPHRTAWDGRDDRGRRVASGVYFYRIIAGDLEETRKMVLLR